MRRAIRRLVLLSMLFLPACTESPSTRVSDNREPPDGGGNAVIRYGIAVGDRAFDISGNTEDGKSIRLSDHRGQVVLVDFWATWCGPCVEMIPHEKAMVEKHAGKPFALLGVTSDSLAKFPKKDQLIWPNILDDQMAIARRWQVNAIPTFILVDPNGIIIGKWVGGAAKDEIAAAVDRAVRGAEAKK